MASNAQPASGDLYNEEPFYMSIDAAPQETPGPLRDNGDLKDVMQRTSSIIKDKFEEIAAWKPKKKKEKDLQEKLEEANQSISALTRENQELQQRLKGSGGGAKGEVERLSCELQQVRSALMLAQRANITLVQRCRGLEHGAVTPQEQDKLQAHAEIQRLTQQLQAEQSCRSTELKQTQELRRNMAELQEAYAQLWEENRRITAEVKKQEAGDLQSTLQMAEQALAAKQEKIDQMKEELFQKEKELETISVLQAQAEVYEADFFAERAAREKIHEEKERLSEQVEDLKEQNRRLQEELDSLAAQSLTQMQRRHRLLQGAGPQGGTTAPAQQKAKGEVKIPEHSCPKCSLSLPDLDTLQIHIMDCID